MELNDIISSGLLELYAAGLTSKEESLQVEQWAAQYPEVAAELKAIQDSVEALAFANAVTPAANVKDKIMSRIENENSAKVIASSKAPVIGIPVYWKWMAAASIILLMGSLMLNVMFYGKYDTASKKLDETQQQLADATQSNDSMKTDMGIVHNKYSMPVALHDMDSTSDATAKVFWMKNTGDVYVDPSNLPDVPQGKQYQLWAIVDGKPVDAGMIVTAKNGDKYRIQKMENKKFSNITVQAFAISLEKEGGNPTPTKVVMMGKM